MTPILNTENDTILVSDINNTHIVVANINGNPCILGKGFGELGKDLCFFLLKNDRIFTNSSANITVGNGFGYDQNHDTPAKMVKIALENDNKVAVFEQDNWKDALQWLIDNCS